MCAVESVQQAPQGDDAVEAGRLARLFIDTYNDPEPMMSPPPIPPSGAVLADPSVRLRDLRKTYITSDREAGVGAALRSLFSRKKKETRAVDGISLDLAPGEIVGFLGPNGAGKTTTLKMLSGLLHPTGGEAAVLGFTPWRREKAFLRQITLVMGQRNQLIWDIPAADTFELLRAIFHLETAHYRRTLGELTDLLELKDLLRKPVRNLSLGERMKCEIAAGLLHSPRVVFLDEPTIGLDVTMQRRIRAFLTEYNHRWGATILLTSHYMADVEALCRRVIVIHHGRLLFDGDLSDLVARFAPHKTIVVRLENPTVDLSAYGEVTERTDGAVTLRVPKAETARVTERLLTDLPVTDLLVEDSSIEDVIARVFAMEEP
jgi:ABC-2 type transport system ATP-binding protein